MHDENAFGILISYFSIEDDEYTLEASAFAERYASYRQQLLEQLASLRLPVEVRALQLGHALYLEFAEEAVLEAADGAASSSEQRRALLNWVKGVRAQLAESGFDTAGIITHGGRWLVEDTSGAGTPRAVGRIQLQEVSLPSEPMRRALYAETACHGVPSDAEAWGPGFYVDTEAVAALGLTPKNAPTPLAAAEATFYRLGR